MRRPQKGNPPPRPTPQQATQGTKRMDETPSTWQEYRLLILRALERVDSQMANLNEKIESQSIERTREITEMKVQIAMLQVKATVGGIMAGAMVSLAVTLVAHYITK